MTNRDILNRELINQLFVRLFNQILDIETQYMVGHGVEDLSYQNCILSMQSVRFQIPRCQQLLLRRL